MNDHNETRMTAEWEPEVKIKRKGGHNAAPERKLITKGVAKLWRPNLLGDVLNNLRHGYEVRLVDGNGNGAIRIFPILSTDMKTVYPHAQTMGDFRRSLEDLKPKLYHRGELLDDVRVRMEKNIQMDKYNKCKEQRRLSVTPDTMVTCPNCGTEFRVGRSNKE